MTGSTHIAAGLAVGCGLCVIIQPSPVLAVVTVPIAAISSLLPDIDTASSKVGCRISLLAWLLKVLFGHRQLFHSLTCWVAVSAAAWFFGAHPIIVFAILCGSLSHLLLDMLNPSGVQLLWPLPQRIALAHLRCGGLLDRILTLLFTGITMWLAFLCVKQYL